MHRQALGKDLARGSQARVSTLSLLYACQGLGKSERSRGEGYAFTSARCPLREQPASAPLSKTVAGRAAHRLA